MYSYNYLRNPQPDCEMVENNYTQKRIMVKPKWTGQTSNDFCAEIFLHWEEENWFLESSLQRWFDSQKLY